MTNDHDDDADWLDIRVIVLIVVHPREVLPLLSSSFLNSSRSGVSSNPARAGGLLHCGSDSKAYVCRPLTLRLDADTLHRLWRI